jgi:hypothetical protein
MTEEPTYLDRLRHVDNLLHSMESDFLAVLAEHQDGQLRLGDPEPAPSPKPPQARVAYSKRLIRRPRKGRNPSPPSTRRHERSWWNARTETDPHGWSSLWWGDWPIW